MARREEATTYNSPRCAMSDMAANHVGQNTYEFNLKSSSRARECRTHLTASPLTVTRFWYPRDDVAAPRRTMPHLLCIGSANRTDPAVGSHIHGDPAWTIHMNLAAVNQNSLKFGM